MIDDPETVTVEVPLRFLTLQAQEDPGLILPASRATCPRCGVTGWAAGQSGCSVEAAIDEMRAECPTGSPYYHDYVAASGTEPPYDLLPA